MALCCISLLVIVCYAFCIKCEWIAPLSPLVPIADNALLVGSYERSIFLLGDFDNDQMFIYSIDDDNFTIISMPDWYTSTYTSSQHYTVVENLLYVINQETLHIYNMETNIFTQDWMVLSETTQDAGCLASTADYLFIIGGLTPSPEYNYKDTVQVLVLSTMQWLTSVSTMNEPRKSGTCIADPVTNKLFAIGGMDMVGLNPRYLSSIEVIYIDNIVSNSWTFIGDMSIPLVGQRTVIHGHMIFIIGGANPSLANSFKSSVHAIDTTTDAVCLLPEQLVYPIAYTSAVIVDNIIYVFCGNNDDGRTDKWMYYVLPTTSTTAPTTSTSTTSKSTTTSTASTSTTMTTHMLTASPITALPAATTTVTPNELLTVCPITTTITTWNPSGYCNDIIVEVINLDGISAYDFMTNEELKSLITNFTANAITRSVDDYGIADDLFFIEYISASDRINITQSVCVEKQNVLNVLNVVIVDKATVIAKYIKYQIILYFKEIDQVSTDDMEVKIYWGSYPISIQEMKIMEIPSIYVTVVILGLFFLFALISLVDAKCVRQNDYFSGISIIMASFEVSDAILDLFFAVFLLLKYLINKDTEILIASIAGFVFIVIPITFSICQLMQKAKKSWFIDDYLSNWLKEYGKILFFFSILTGSAYTAVEIVNCGAFKLDIFNMGLNKQERIKFNAKRVIGVVCLENIPQMVIQLWYLVRFGADFLPILSIIFSIVSIILSVLTIYTQRTIIKNQEVFKIEFDIIGDNIKPKLSTKTHGIKSEIGVLLGVRDTLMEIQKPKVVPKGLRFEICLFINNVSYRNLNCKTTITTAIHNRELVNIIQNEWNLETAPIIANPKFIPVDEVEEIGYPTTSQYASVNTDDEGTMHVQMT